MRDFTLFLSFFLQANCPDPGILCRASLAATLKNYIITLIFFLTTFSSLSSRAIFNLIVFKIKETQRERQTETVFISVFALGAALLSEGICNAGIYSIRILKIKK